MGIKTLINSFNSGELSPLLSSRQDVSQYQSGCSLLENFIVTPYGAVEGRPGTKYLETTKFNDKKSVLLPFVFSLTDKYILEFGDYHLRILVDGEYLMTGDQPYELETPYASTEVEQIKTFQSADVMFLAHPNYFPRKLSRLTDTTFSLEEIDITYPPVQEPNVTDTTITPNAVTGSGITLTASDDLFSEAHIGSYWEITHVRTNSQVVGTFNATDQTSSTLPVEGQWNMVSRGTWAGTLQVQKSFDGGSTWVDFRSYSSASDKNFDATGEENEKGVLYRLKMSAHTAGSCKYELRNDDFYTNGVVRITAFTSEKVVTADVIKTLGATTATKDWAEASWSDQAGYPRAICCHDERLLFAGTVKQPQTIWGSRVGDWSDFESGDLDDDALDYTIVGGDRYMGTICWMSSQDNLLLGTSSSEWKVASTSDGKPLTPTNVSAKRQSNFGSHQFIQAQIVGDSLLYVQRQGRKVREFAYDFQKDGYVSPDMNMLAEHITDSGVVSTALQQQPDTILWGVRADGQLIGLTYERDQKVVGWHRHITEGSFESIAVIPGDVDDEVYVVVNRTINNSPVRYIEKFNTRYWDDIKDAIFCDSAIIATPVDKVVTGLNHLEGCTVQVFGDGAVQSEKKVMDGQIVIDSDVASVTVGLAFLPRLRPMPLELQLQDGTSAFRIKRICQVRLKVSDTVGGNVKINEGDGQELVTRQVADVTDSAVQPYSGNFKVTEPGGFSEEPTIEISQPDPLPITIVSLSPTFEVHE
jgi:hypothetical protein